MLPGAEGDAVRRKRVGYALFAVASMLALGFAMGWNPPTAKVHGFTEASDYDPVKEAGCVGSGEGCHGSEERYADFNDYHPDAECTSCHEYQGVGCIPCHKPKEHECVLCHDGSKDGVPDTVRLTDPYPRGHYRETTHTAGGTDMAAEVRTAEGGKAAATCRDCHSRDLREAHTGVPVVAGSEYGPSIGCGECHNDVRSRGMAEVLADWKGRRCEDCHAIGTSSAMHGAEVADSVKADASEGCAGTGSGCHAGDDVHALHPDAPETCAGSAADGEPGCHDLGIESHEPTGTACGAGAEGSCHAGYPAADLGHKEDAEAHSPETSGPAADTSAFGIACGDCHAMGPDGTSLIDEHALPTSERRNVEGDVCRDCHNDPASAEAVAGGWETRDGGDACGACHGRDGLDAAHDRDLTAVHAAEDSAGCAESGPGCHPGGELNDIGEPTAAGGLHAACLRCHDRSRAGANRAYDPSADSCGEGRACHGAAGEYDPSGGVHDGAGGRADGADSAHHRAGGGQASATLRDGLTGLRTDCGACHSMTLGVEHDRPNASTSRTPDLCGRCHNDGVASAGVVKGDWARRDGEAACAACHDGDAAAVPHAGIGEAHGGIELALDGSPEPGACVRSGCHGGADLRELHRSFGCTARGCHRSSGDIRGEGLTGCGGLDAATSCHAGFSAGSGHRDLDALHAAVERDTTGVAAAGFCAKAGCHLSVDVRVVHEDVGCTIAGCHTGQGSSAMSCGGDGESVACHPGYQTRQHFVDHSADLTGTVNGVAYGPGTNEGCFGCHAVSLSREHVRELNAGSMDGEAAGGCRVCHFEDDDPGSGEYSDRAAVKRAIAERDLRCIACHASGSADDGSEAVASPHKATSAEDPLPASRVWSDPFGDWKAAFDATTGSGHNVLDADSVGAAAGKRFPLTEFALGGTARTWALPPNSGATAWLRADVFGEDAVATPESISHISIGCDDCHIVPEEATGPHGASVRVYIDPAYSQTEYANPTPLTYQFFATGTDRVVCFKCHPMQASRDPVVYPGGHSAHRRHVDFADREYPDTDPRYFGLKCVDCHVRIPHAWKRPRLLVRAVDTTDGVEADGPPYVRDGHEGLVGIVLRDFNVPRDLRSVSCVTGGCHDGHRAATHPMPSDIPDAQYWP